MRNPDNRKQVEKLFVLGAGASLAATAVSTRDGSAPTYQAPLDAEFARRITELDLQRPGWVASARDRIATTFRPTGSFEEYRLEEAIQLVGVISADLRNLIKEPEVWSAIDRLYIAHENLRWYLQAMLNETRALRAVVEASL